MYRAGSFSDAGRTLGISQPTVTNHIGTLEGRLGSALFIRTISGVEPTPSAYDLAAVVSEPLDFLDRLLTDGEVNRGVLRGIALGSPREFMIECALPALSSIVDRLPNLNVDFDDSRRLLDDLESGRYDLVISTVRPTHPDLLVWPLTDEEFWLVGPPGTDLATSPLSALSKSPMIAINRDMAIVRRFWNFVYRAEPNFDPSIIVPDLLAVRQAAVSGFGIAVLPSYLVWDDIAAGRLVRIDDTVDTLINTVFLVARRSAVRSRPRLGEVARLIVARIKAHTAERDSAAAPAGGQS